jgi:telomere length regulation protein
MSVAVKDRGIVVQESLLLRSMFGALQPESDVWNGVLGVMLSRDWKESHARIFVSWAAGAKTGPVNSEGRYSNQILMETHVNRDAFSAPGFIVAYFGNVVRYRARQALTAVAASL